MSKIEIRDLTKELVSLVVLLIVMLIGLKIVFSKEAFMVLIKLTLSLFWMFILPGSVLMFYWKDKLDLIERVLMGITLSSAIIGILSYYLAMLGFQIKYSAIILPLVVMIVMAILTFKKFYSEDSKKDNKQNEFKDKELDLKPASGEEIVK